MSNIGNVLNFEIDFSKFDQDENMGVFANTDYLENIFNFSNKYDSYDEYDIEEKSFYQMLYENQTIKFSNRKDLQLFVNEKTEYHDPYYVFYSKI